MKSKLCNQIMKPLDWGVQTYVQHFCILDLAVQMYAQIFLQAWDICTLQCDLGRERGGLNMDCSHDVNSQSWMLTHSLGAPMWLCKSTILFIWGKSNIWIGFQFPYLVGNYKILWLFWVLSLQFVEIVFWNSLWVCYWLYMQDIFLF
jgi:hypothetical protein